MKKITWIAFLAISLFGILVLCCKNNFGPDSTVKGNGINIGEALDVSITTDEHLQIFKIDNSASARTISSDAFKIGASGDALHFYLYGTAQSGQTQAPKEVTVTSTDGINGKVTLDIDCYNWELTLVACETADLTTETAILDDAVLIGYANVDMLFTNSIKFTLSPKGLTKKGNVSLAIERKDDWTIPADYIAKAGIFDLTSMRPVLGGASADQDLTQQLADYSLATVSDLFIGSTNNDAYFEDSDNANYTANGKELAPGTYLFQIEFTKANENRRYVWNDTIIVLPGKTTNAINIKDGTTNKYTQRISIPNLIGEKPVAPTDFQVTYNEDEDAESNGYYTAEFTWDGSATVTETNFALQLMELDEAATVASAVSTDTAWDTLWAAAKNTYEFNYLNDIRADARFYKSGSLFANNSSITLYLELGKRYLARLYSENNAGYSTTPAYVEVQNDSAGNAYTTINRYRVTYHLQGGTWKTTSDSRLDQIEYWGQSDNDYDVINPCGTDDGTGTIIGDATHPYLVNPPATWLYWAESLSGNKYAFDAANPYDPDDYSDFKNLDLYAVYSREGDVEVYNDRDYDILPAYVAGFGLTAGNVNKETVNVFSKATATGTPKTTTVSVTLPTGTDTWLYDKVIFEITYGGRTYFANEQVGEARGTANTFTVDLSNFPTGYIYNCKLTAHHQRTVVSYPFTVSITD